MKKNIQIDLQCRRHVLIFLLEARTSAGCCGLAGGACHQLPNVRRAIHDGFGAFVAPVSTRARHARARARARTHTHTHMHTNSHSQHTPSRTHTHACVSRTGACKDSERNRESSLASEQQEGHKRRARQAAPLSHQRARLTGAECRGYARHAPRACGAASDTQSPRGVEPLATPSTRTHTHTLIYHLHTPSHRLQ